MSPPREPPPSDLEDPWIGPGTWYNYRCQTCDHVDWVEAIIFDAFPATPPSRGPLLLLPRMRERPLCLGRIHAPTASPRQPEASVSASRAVITLSTAPQHVEYNAPGTSHATNVAPQAPDTNS